jgi:hypothetical protein
MLPSHLTSITLRFLVALARCGDLLLSRQTFVGRCHRPTTSTSCCTSTALPGGSGIGGGEVVRAGSCEALDAVLAAFMGAIEDQG